MTDRYLNVHHHAEVSSLVEWARENDYQLVAVDNMEGSTPIAETALPERAVLIFGQESNGLSAELLAAADSAVYIPQYGSTRSMNVAAAAAISMHMWIMQHGPRNAPAPESRPVL